LLPEEIMRRLFSLLLVLAACSSSSSQQPAQPAGDDGGAPPAPPPENPGDAGVDAPVKPPVPPFPQIPNNGGPVIASPEIVTITWDGDPIGPDLEAFDDWMVPSAFWKTLMAEWGVGPGAHSKSMRIPTAAPASLFDADVHKIITDAVAAGTIPPPNGSRIYTVYPPSGTDVFMSAGVKGCETFQAYHSSFATATGLAVYAITPRCDGGKADNVSPTDYVTWGQSHEIMEASSDPDGSHPAWLILQQTPQTPELGENADLCTGNPTLVEGHLVTRNYSNVAAAKGDPPCVPAPPGPAFGAFPDTTEVTLAPGTKTTVKLHLYAAGPVPAFDVITLGAVPELTTAQDKKQGNDGDVVTVTISASTKYVEEEGSNIIRIYALSKDYASRRAVIVHAK
jgi:hypothetical protein